MRRASTPNPAATLLAWAWACAWIWPWACPRTAAAAAAAGATANRCAHAGPTVDVCIRIDASAPGTAVNRRVLGSNVQWVDGGDDLLRAGTVEFDPVMQSLVTRMNPTVLRYPGGEQSDGYHFAAGLGPPAARRPNPQVPGTHTQITYMGSAEVLAQSRALGAATVFTVNVVTGTAAEAAAWVRETNVTGLHDADGHTLPKVEYWEIGNEPYLPSPDSRNPRTCEVDPLTYASRVNSFAQSMRVVDPAIKIGVALANDVQNGIPFVSPGCPQFAATVLEHLTEPIDFISIHDAYLPYDPSGRDHAASDEFRAAMAATQSLEADLDAMRRRLMRYPKLRALPFAVTEYAALFSPNPRSAFAHSMASPMGALYVADALRVFADRDDVLMANHWSLSGNDHWGAIHPPDAHGGAFGRAVYEIFRLYGTALEGVRLDADVAGPSFDAPNLGFSAAAGAVPTVATLVTRSDAPDAAAVLRVLMINKDFTQAHTAILEVAHAALLSAELTTLSTTDVLASDDRPNAWQRSVAQLRDGNAPIPLPAHGIGLLTLRLARPSP